MSSIPTDADQDNIALLFDFEGNLDAVDYRRIMDRIIKADEYGDPVSAFNSSI